MDTQKLSSRLRFHFKSGHSEKRAAGRRLSSLFDVAYHKHGYPTSNSLAETRSHCGRSTACRLPLTLAYWCSLYRLVNW